MIRSVHEEGEMSDEPKEKRFSHTQIAIAGLAAAIALIIIMVLISISGAASG